MREQVGWYRSLCAGAALQAILTVCQAQAPARDSRLPDGTEFSSWERELQFTKTYYVDGNATRADDNSPGSRERPFHTIAKAAEVLQPGERECYGWEKNGALGAVEELSFDPNTLSMTLIPRGEWPKVPLFNSINTDLFGAQAGETRVPGPFANLAQNFRQRKIDPRRLHGENEHE